MANNEKCECKTVIKELSSLDLQNCSDKDVQAILNKLYDKPIAAPLCDYPVDTVIVRGRPITSTQQIKFKHELSYVPADKNKSTKEQVHQIKLCFMVFLVILMILN